MKERPALNRILTSAFLALTILMAIGPRPLRGQSQAPKEKDLVWPPPPEKARIRWVESIFFAEDFMGESGAQRLLRKLTGQGRRRLFVYPNDVTTDDRGRIFVSDTGGGRVVVLDTQRRKIDIWTGRNPRLVGPTGLAYARKVRRLFVSDSYGKRVLGFDDQGKVQLVISQKLDRPGGLAVDEQRERLYVVDVQGHHVDVFDLKGSWIRTIGERGDAPGQFNFPNYIALDRDGFLYVSDMGNFRVQVLTPDGQVVNAFGQPGRRPGDLMRPKGVAVDSEYHIYVVDAMFNNIQIFDVFGRVYLAVGEPGTGPGQFLLPAGLHIDDKDRVYVVDQRNMRLQILQYLASGEKAPAPSRVATPGG